MSDTKTEKKLEDATTGKFRQQDLDKAQALVGQEFASEYRDYITEATHDSMRNFARCYGDDNPLYCDENYGVKTRWGGQVASPSQVQAMSKPLLGDRKAPRVGFRGIHNFVSGSTLDWYRPVNKGDSLYRFGGLESTTMKESEFAGRSLIQVNRSTHINQRAEVVAISRTLVIYVERSAAREKKKNAAIEPASYTPEDIARHDAIYETEHRRGAEQRYWEDVAVGEQLPQIAKGPLTVTDIIIFIAGGYGFHFNPATGRLGYENRRRIPAFYIPNEQGVPDISMRVHWDPKWAQAIGNPMAYDYGVMRDCWMSHLLTDWIGDDGWLQHMHTEIRAFNYLGDMHVMSGVVTGKRREGAQYLVDVRVAGVNQRGVETCFSTATVALPSREGGPVMLPNPPEEATRSAVEFWKQHHRELEKRGDAALKGV